MLARSAAALAFARSHDLSNLSCLSYSRQSTPSVLLHKERTLFCRQPLSFHTRPLLSPLVINTRSPFRFLHLANPPRWQHTQASPNNIHPTPTQTIAAEPVPEAAPAPKPQSKWWRRIAILLGSLFIGMGATMGYQYSTKTERLKHGAKAQAEIVDALQSLLRECTNEAPGHKFNRLFGRTVSDPHHEELSAEFIYQTLASVPVIRTGITHVVPFDMKYLVLGWFCQALLVAKDGSICFCTTFWMYNSKNELRVVNFSVREVEGKKHNQRELFSYPIRPFQKASK